ncbi:TPA: reverse transcriptase family protein [Photobacterium damselae]
MKNKIKLSDDLRAFLTSEESLLVREIKIKNSFFYSIENDEYKKKIKEFSFILRDNTSINNSCYGFVKGSSYLDFLLPHKESTDFIRLDISSFFHSIKIDKVESELLTLFSDHLFVKGIISKVTTVVAKNSMNTQCRGKNIVPMGFPSSPLLSNLIFRPIDIIISKYCVENNIIYSRYADDMMFSSKISSKIKGPDLKRFVSKLLLKNGFTLNAKKTLLTQGHISLNGYVVGGENMEIKLSNKKLKRINKITHEILKNGLTLKEVGIKIYGFDKSRAKYSSKQDQFFDSFCHDQVLDKIRGYRSYLIGIIKFTKKNKTASDSKNKQYSLMIDRLNMILNEN